VVPGVRGLSWMERAVEKGSHKKDLQEGKIIVGFGSAAHIGGVFTCGKTGKKVKEKRLIIQDLSAGLLEGREPGVNPTVPSKLEGEEPAIRLGQHQKLKSEATSSWMLRIYKRKTSFACLNEIKELGLRGTSGRR